MTDYVAEELLVSHERKRGTSSGTSIVLPAISMPLGSGRSGEAHCQIVYCLYTHAAKSEVVRRLQVGSKISWSKIVLRFGHV